MSDTPPSPQLEAGAYEVIRKRLDAQGSELRSRLEKLNEARKAIFGGIETQLLSTARLTTENNCVPRDMRRIGRQRFLFGYNVTLGLKSQLDPADVFSIYDYDAADHSFHVNKDGLLTDKRFVEDFHYLYQYYKNASFQRFHRTGATLYLVFQVGRDPKEVKAFKWLVDEDAGTLEYQGNRFDHEIVLPERHEFAWKKATHDMFRHGTHPHVSIEDRVFVETVGGDLTVKVEDNTATGSGIYSEPVDHADQILDDAQYQYAILGNLILIKVLPYQEKQWRHLVFNERTQEVRRIDAIAESCLLLPDEHGIVFPRGYVLQTGGVKLFDTGLPEMQFERKVTSANGEDTLYVFHHIETGLYLLLSYNLVEQEMAAPLAAHGAALFSNGTLIVLNAEDEARKHHAVQVWQTPFVAEQQAAGEGRDSLLGKLGNAEIVRCMAECRGILTLLGKDDSYSGLYVELVKQAGDIADSYFWLDKPEAQGIRATLLTIKEAAEAALAEFEKVRRLRIAADKTVKDLTESATKAVREAESASHDEVGGYVKSLATLRTLRGQIIAAQEVRYVDEAALKQLDERVAGAAESVGGKCTEFLLQPEALAPYDRSIAEQRDALEKIAKVTEADELDEQLRQTSEELELLISVVSSLKIRDATETTRITESISAQFAQLNQVRSRVKARRDELAKSEGEAEFFAQINLLKQAVINQVELCDTPEKCDDALTRMLVRIEELEGRFGDFEGFADELIQRREETQSAFDARRQQLVETRNRKTQALVQAADRVLASIRNRLATLNTPEEVHSYLASDAMAAKARDLIADLRDQGDAVRADEVQTRLKTLQEGAVKQIRDKADLFVEGGDVIKLGPHAFSVNKQPLDLTLVTREDGQHFHITGTRYSEKVEDAELESLRPVWSLESAAESPAVYRGEYLAHVWIGHLAAQGAEALAEFATLEMAQRQEAIRGFMAERFAEGYTKGVHDHDAALIAQPLAELRGRLGRLRHAPMLRAWALLLWRCLPEGREKTALAARLQGQGSRAAVFGNSMTVEQSDGRLREAMEKAVSEQGIALSAAAPLPAVALCLTEELQGLTSKQSNLPLTRSHTASEMARGLAKLLAAKRAATEFAELRGRLKDDPLAEFELLQDWLGAANPDAAQGDLAEAAAILLYEEQPAGGAEEVATRLTLEGLAGAHPRIEGGRLALDYHEFQTRLLRHEREVVPLFRAMQARKHALVQQRRAALRLEEFRPGMLSSFVRNRLIDQVYLPIIGANLAKQLGAVGADTRTDRMGLLMLISPPGYGKTTLIEYVANRLGMAMVKVNGPAIGHQVTSLDPQEAPNASARQEIEKLNLAFEMGDNVMIYLDDIQHCNPEFLQKFIPLCDGQRRIEGVFQGDARTYDLRGRKVAVVMAGNPYTEVGGKFQVPDMLANRADTYNLGDILGGHEAAFKASYIENCLTSNRALSRIAARSHVDALAVMKIAETDSRDGVEFEANHQPDEMEESIAVMKHLLRVREVIEKVNGEYVRSAATEEAYRTEPAFKLQGSYRNMNRIAEKVQPLMTAEEVEALIEDHYRGESQTLSKAAEANLLKWKELTGKLDDTEAARWDDIRKTFRRNLLTGSGGDNDPVTRIGGYMNAFTAGLERIHDTMEKAREEQTQPATLADVTVEKLEAIIASLRAVPVNVEIKVLPVEQGAETDLPVEVDSKVEQPSRPSGRAPKKRS
ncbi:MAG: DNA repair ATPase [Verrucomicrobiales bacterium]|nr:DNA repair ATPase [Verrucomicrobiales bacterium]